VPHGELALVDFHALEVQRPAPAPPQPGWLTQWLIRGLLALREGRLVEGGRKSEQLQKACKGQKTVQKNDVKSGSKLSGGAVHGLQALDITSGLVA
jgi:hypothetical protein